jgi:hypothetical protein
MLHWQTKLTLIGLAALAVAAFTGKCQPIGYFWT